MVFNLKNRNFLKLLDFTPEEINFFINLSSELKKEKYAKAEQQRLRGKNIVLIFEKASTRTRCAFEIAAYDQGACVTCLGPKDSQMDKKESVKDTAKVLGRMYDGIGYRGFEQKKVEKMGEYAKVPVWNALTNEFHPTQILADFLTMMEHSNKPLSKIKLAYLGNARNNVANSLLIGAAKMGIYFSAIAPKKLWPDNKIVKQAEDIADKTGTKILITDNLEKGVRNCDFLYTDVWVSIGESEHVWEERIRLLRPYQISNTKKSYEIN